MDWHLWLGFVAASFAIAVVPGPGVMSIVGYAVSGGRRVALASVAGLAIGNATAMTLSLAGVGVLLAASALAFSILKWAGALYLIGLGVLTIIRSRPVANASVALPPREARTAFLGNIAVGTFHPKTIVFFVAFAPQFIRPDAGYAGQATVLVATFVGVVALSDTLYALAASRASGLLRRPRTMAWAKRLGGGVLVASGVATAAART